eukprot:SAG11_NODE_9781_length_881_cov_1.101023_2_plen_178_part_01
MIKPDAMRAGHKEAIMTKVRASGFSVLAEEECTLSEAQVNVFYAEHKDADFFGGLVSLMATPVAPEPEEGEEPEVVEPNTLTKLVLEKRGAVTAWRTIIGPTLAEEARETAPGSLRALYGSEEEASANAVHGSKTPNAAMREIDLMFKMELSEAEASMEPELTYAMVKPHAVAAGALP